MEFFSGRYKSSFKGTGLDFSETREYRPGDDIRFIDWNVSARAGKTHIKVYNEERRLNLLIAIDVSASMKFSTGISSKSDIAAEIAAVIGYSALNNNDITSLLFFSDRIEKYSKPNNARTLPAQMLHSLFSIEPAGTKTDISIAAEFMFKVLKRKTVIFIISDFFDDNYFHHLKKLTAKHDVICISLKDPFESRYIKNSVCVSFADLENNSIVNLDLNSRDVYENYISNFSHNFNSFNKKMKENNISTLNISIAENYLIPLYNFFKKRG